MLQRELNDPLFTEEEVGRERGGLDMALDAFSSAVHFSRNVPRCWITLYLHLYNIISPLKLPFNTPPPLSATMPNLALSYNQGLKTASFLGYSIVLLYVVSAPPDPLHPHHMIPH